MVTTAHVEAKLTAVQIILLAAEDLTHDGKLEFSEFELTVAAWSRDRLKFGLRGFAQTYPDHKRVMMEIMGQKPNSPVFRKLLEKVRPNFYRLTALGKETARRLRASESTPAKPTLSAVPRPVASKPSGVKELYDLAAQYTARPEFRRWQDNPEEPREWAGAAAFLGLIPGIEIDPAKRLETIRGAIKSAMEWCAIQETAHLTRGGPSFPPIHVRDLSDMLDFLQALIYRFPEKLEAEEPKAVKRFEN